MQNQLRMHVVLRSPCRTVCFFSWNLNACRSIEGHAKPAGKACRSIITTCKTNWHAKPNRTTCRTSWKYMPFDMHFQLIYTCSAENACPSIAERAKSTENACRSTERHAFSAEWKRMSFYRTTCKTVQNQLNYTQDRTTTRISSRKCIYSFSVEKACRSIMEGGAKAAENASRSIELKMHVSWKCMSFYRTTCETS